MRNGNKGLALGPKSEQSASMKRDITFNEDLASAGSGTEEMGHSAVQTPDEAMGEVLEWLAAVDVSSEPLAMRALGACAYDALGALAALRLQAEVAATNMRDTADYADGAVGMPALESVINLHHS